jgi:hypothetical protein
MQDLKILLILFIPIDIHSGNNDFLFHRFVFFPASLLFLQIYIFRFLNILIAARSKTGYKVPFRICKPGQASATMMLSRHCSKQINKL